MKKIILGYLIILFSACTKPHTDNCIVNYRFYFKKNGIQLCLKNDEQLLAHYSTDSIRVFELKPIGETQRIIRYNYDIDSCLFLKSTNYFPDATIILGGINKQDTLSFEVNAKNVKYYLNGQFQYEIKYICSKIYLDCIIEI